MNNNDLEKNIYNAIDSTKPDHLAKIKARCLSATQEKVTFTRGFNWWKPLAAVAMAAVMIFGGLNIYNTQKARAVFATVGLDVNPSLELQINAERRVIDVKANNDDGAKIIAGMDFKGSDIKVAVNAMIGSMVRNGYLSELTNSILISVQNGDPDKAEELQKQLTAEIDSLLKSSAFEGAILSQTVNANATVELIAREYGITYGKAQLIQEIADKSVYTASELAGLSINDLNLILHHLTNSTIVSVGEPSEKKYIGEAKAVAVAVEDAGIPEADRDGLYFEVEIGYEKGVMVYEVEFVYNGKEYDYDINAVTGAVVKKENEKADKETTTPKNVSQNYIGKAKAKELVLSHAGVSAAKVTGYVIELDRDNGTVIYEIEFDAEGYEYEYEVNATTGKIISAKKEKDDNVTTTTPKATVDNLIGREKARQAALKHAGVSESAATGMKVELDEGKYEVEFFANGYEYDYEINAVTGDVMKSEKEKTSASSSTNTGTSTTPSTTTTAISADKAKEIAFKHAGVAAASAKSVVVRSDLEDGVKVFEVDFIANGFEYDYEINATNGDVLKSEKEKVETVVNNSTSSSGSSTTSSSTSSSTSSQSTSSITADKAKSIAFNHAGVSASDAREVKVHKDWENGIQVYEVDFKVGNYEYDYEINAASGKIIKAERELDD